MKLYELAKELNLKVPDILKLTHEMGYKYGSGNVTMTDEEYSDVRSDIKDYEKQRDALKKEAEKYSTARFLGCVYNKQTKKFERILMCVKMTDLANVEKDLQILGEHDTIYGAKLTLHSDFAKNILTNPEHYN